MPKQKIGTLVAQGQLLGTIKEPVEKYSISKTGLQHEVQYVAPWLGMEALVPKYYSADPKYPGLVLITGQSDKWMGNLARIKLTYATPDFGGSSDGTPPDEFNESATAQEIDIQLNPRFQDINRFVFAGTPNADIDLFPLGARVYTSGIDAEGKATKIFAGFRKGSAWCGTTSCYNGGISVTHVKYFTNKPARSPAVRIADVPDSYYTSAGNWLRLTSEVNKSGLYYIRRDTYLYSDKLWDTDTYAST